MGRVKTRLGASGAFSPPGASNGPASLNSVYGAAGASVLIDGDIGQ